MEPQFIKAGVLIRQNNKFLLVQEKTKRAFGLWNIPSGKVEEGETVIKTAIREAKEETGYTIVIEKELLIIREPFTDTKELHIFLGKIDSGVITIPKEEILDVQWFTYQEIENMKDFLVGNWIIKVVQDLWKC
jgi:ADP-ribose pyrophosphatase YjhB (NUDIX family)